MKKTTLIFCLTFFCTYVQAQISQITGTVKDTSSTLSVKNAVVMLLSPKDSILKAFTRVKEDGTFALPNVKQGNYILQVSHQSFANFVDDISVTTTNFVVPKIALTSKSKLLQEVIVKSGKPMRLKGDTTIYTADSFKVSANANVEELLKKMPGIQVDKNGTIKAMGETVEKVLVDGEEFFGDDPGMTVKNLRADAVKEVQVFDKKSEQSEFTGIDDGQTKKTINLKLKEDKKHGYFGKIDVAAGPYKGLDTRYNNNILLSSFKGKRKLSGFLLDGNTGQDGLNWQDEQKYSGGSDNMVVDEDAGFTYYNGRRGSDEEPYINPENGFMTNVNAGLQYTNKFNNDKTTLNLTPKYNRQAYNNNELNYSKVLLNSDSNFTTQGFKNSTINRYNVKFRGTLDLKLDSAATTLKITANTNFYHTESEEKSADKTKNQDSVTLNETQKLYTTKTDKTALSTSIILKHKFKKARRTISFTTDVKNQTVDGNNLLQSFNYTTGNVLIIDQMKDNKKTTTNVSSKLTYTEPLSKKYSLELGYQLGFNYGNNNQITYVQTPSSGKYDIRVDTLSNYFKQNIIQQTPSAKINFANKKFKINVGAGVALTHFVLDDITYNKSYKRDYANFSPTANLTYTYKPNHNLNVSYNGSTTQPTIDQLQPLRNNNDLFNQRLGNINLKPSFNNNFSISHNSYNFIKDMWAYQSFNANFTSNAITENRIINKQNGAITTQPINTDGNLSFNTWCGTGFKAKKIDTRIQVNFNGSLNKYSDFQDNVKISTTNLSTGIGTYINKSKEKKYDVSLSASLDYNNNKTSNNKSKVNYTTNRISIDGRIYYKKVWSLQTDVENYNRQKVGQIAAFSNTKWNAQLQRTFKKDEFTAYLSIKDILNQNIGIDRNFSGNTFTETRNDRLKRYVMIGFTWNFKNKATTAKK